jgi:formimidoylglutamate deiminase
VRLVAAHGNGKNPTVGHELVLPGFVNAHSHAFQRALRGRAGGGDFWAWREEMLAEAGRQTPETVRREYELTYRELLAAGYTAVGEFHYLGFDEALAASEAAEAAGITFALLYAAYERGGLERFRQASVADYLRDVDALRERGLSIGLAPHSVRACSREWLQEIGAYADSAGLPLHIHACEQPREVEDCVAEHGRRPVELLAEAGCLTSRTTVVHATHASDAELDLLAAAGAAVCVCPTTEAYLADGFAPVAKLVERRIGLSIGSDANVRVDPLEELRQLDGLARRATLRRDVFAADQLLAVGSSGGAAALGLARWPQIAIDRSHPELRGVAEADLLTALVESCSAAVIEGVHELL